MYDNDNACENCDDKTCAWCVAEKSLRDGEEVSYMVGSKIYVAFEEANAAWEEWKASNND